MKFPEFEVDQRSEPSMGFHSEDVAFTLPNSEKIFTWLSAVIEQEHKELYQVDFIFCSDVYLHQVNLQYLDHDYLTDVITFPYSTTGIEGDVFISLDRVRENSLLAGDDFFDELHRVMLHGVLHLIGYDDKAAAKKKAMREAEDFYLSLLTR